MAIIYTRFIEYYFSNRHTSRRQRIDTPKMFESFVFVDKLIDMGKIILCDPHRATVIGINREYNLRGIQK